MRQRMRVASTPSCERSRPCAAMSCAAVNGSACVYSASYKCAWRRGQPYVIFYRFASAGAGRMGGVRREISKAMSLRLSAQTIEMRARRRRVKSRASLSRARAQPRHRREKIMSERSQLPSSNIIVMSCDTTIELSAIYGKIVTNFKSVALAAARGAGVETCREARREKISWHYIAHGVAIAPLAAFLRRGARNG